MSDLSIYVIVLLMGVLIGVFVSPKGPGGGSGACPYCGRYHG